MSYITPTSCLFLISLTIIAHLPLQKCEESESDDVEIFYARDPQKIQQLSLVEDKLVVSLLETVLKSSSSPSTDNGNCFDSLLKYIKEYEQDSKGAVDGKHGWNKARKIADNPLLTFKMVKRLFLTLTKEVMISCEENRFAGVNEKIEEVFKKTGTEFPVERDWDDALSGIVILQFVYQLKTEELRRGILNGTATNVVLYGDHCHAIAKKALEMEGDVMAYQWLEQAELSYMDNLEEKSANKDALEKTWKRLLQLTGLQTVEQLHSNMTSRQQTRLKGLGTVRWHAPCRGDILMDVMEQASTLKCLWYTNRYSGYFAINPLKIEVLSNRFMYLQMHDFVGPKAMQTIKNLKTEDDMKGNMNNTGLLGLLKKIEITTGMSYARWRTGYWFSTISTPLGGYCNVQSLRDEKFQPGIKEEDKLTTLILFLSDVEMGGYASFQKAGIAAKPIKGSAIFYYNSPNEMKDIDKTILRCPVLIGSQETATQWMLKSENKDASM